MRTKANEDPHLTGQRRKAKVVLALRHNIFSNNPPAEQMLIANLKVFFPRFNFEDSQIEARNLLHLRHDYYMTMSRIGTPVHE